MSLNSGLLRSRCRALNMAYEGKPCHYPQPHNDFQPKPCRDRARVIVLSNCEHLCSKNKNASHGFFSTPRFIPSFFGPIQLKGWFQHVSTHQTYTIADWFRTFSVRLSTVLEHPSARFIYVQAVSCQLRHVFLSGSCYFMSFHLLFTGLASKFNVAHF